MIKMTGVKKRNIAIREMCIPRHGRRIMRNVGLSKPKTSAAIRKLGYTVLNTKIIRRMTKTASRTNYMTCCCVELFSIIGSFSFQAMLPGGHLGMNAEYLVRSKRTGRRACLATVGKKVFDKQFGNWTISSKEL